MKCQKIRPNMHIAYDQPLQPYHVKIAELVCRHTENFASVLDIGCGVGHVLAQIHQHKPSLKLFAADIDKKLLEMTQQRVQLHASFQIVAVEDLVEKNLRFDAIIMSHVLEHIPRPLDTVKEVMTTLLRPAGIAVFAVPNVMRLAIIAKNVLRQHYVNRGHLYAWDRSHWINFLENIPELHVIRYDQDYVHVPFLHKITLAHPLERWLVLLLPWLSFSNIAVATNVYQEKSEL